MEVLFDMFTGKNKKCIINFTNNCPFIVEEIDTEVLKLMTPEYARAIVSSCTIGVQIKFQENLKLWQTAQVYYSKAFIQTYL